MFGEHGCVRTWDNVSKSREMHPAISLVARVATVDCVKHQKHHRTATSVFYFGSGVTLSMKNMFGVACLLNSPLISLAVATNQSGDPVG